MSASARTGRRRHPGRDQELREMLARRERAATVWTQAVSHGTGATGPLLQELARLELILTQRWPHLAAIRLHEWIAVDAARLHDPASAPRRDCPRCRARTDRAA